MNKGGFSWKRLLGITKAKRKVSRKTGISQSKSGRQQKIERMTTKGCSRKAVQVHFSLGFNCVFGSVYAISNCLMQKSIQIKT